MYIKKTPHRRQEGNTRRELLTSIDEHALSNCVSELNNDVHQQVENVLDWCVFHSVRLFQHGPWIRCMLLVSIAINFDS